MAGGAHRSESVRAGIAVSGNADIVLVHDAARPFIAAAVIDRLLAALDDHDGAIPGLPVADTLVTATGAPVAREGLHRVQTPQAFAFQPLLAASS